MQELIHMAFSGVNLIYTIFLLLALVYWLSVILGALSMDALDFDVDVDADVDLDVDLDLDVDADVDADIEAEAVGSTGWFVSALHFFNFGRIPFMIIWTVTSLSMWLISVYLQQHFGPSWGMAIALLIPNLFVGLIVTKIVTTPLIPVFERMDKGEQPVDYLGMECKLLFDLEPGEKGQGEVILENHTTLLITVMLADDQKALSKNQKVFVVTEDKSKELFYVKAPEL